MSGTRVTKAKTLRREAVAIDKEVAKAKREYDQGSLPTMTWDQLTDLVRRQEAIVAAVAG